MITVVESGHMTCSVHMIYLVDCGICNGYYCVLSALRGLYAKT